MEKNKIIKLEEKDLNEIKSLRDENSRLTVDFGRVRLEMILLRAKLSEMEKMDNDMEAKYKGNRTKEKKLVEKLNKKYGRGSVDIEKGIFIPVEDNNG
tara:strand:+ start:543 stop:836 length:294 start_codon:yes stop_codon:yes gene_type:complete